MSHLQSWDCCLCAEHKYCKALVNRWPQISDKHQLSALDWSVLGLEVTFKLL